MIDKDDLFRKHMIWINTHPKALDVFESFAESMFHFLTFKLRMPDDVALPIAKSFDNSP